MPTRLTLSCIAAAASLAVAGCNIFAPAYFIVAGPGNVDREYELDKNARTVVFVDDPSSRIATRRIRVAIGEAAQDEIVRQRLLDDGNVIDARAALAATSRDRDDAPLSIAEIGRAVEADTVIYVLVTGFDATPVSADSRAFAELRVKVIDCATAERLWPLDNEAGYPLRVTLPIDAGVIGATSRSEALQAQRALAERTGLAVSQLFHTVEILQSVRR